MATSSTESVALIPLGESCQRAGILKKKVFKNILKKKGQALSQTLTDWVIIVGLVFEHTSVELVVVQKLDTRATLLVFPEDIDVKESTTLWLVEI